jgi:hypothetical protein
MSSCWDMLQSYRMQRNIENLKSTTDSKAQPQRLKAGEQGDLISNGSWAAIDAATKDLHRRGELIPSSLQRDSRSRN